MTTIIAGSRSITDYHALLDTISFKPNYLPITCVVSGHARGVDTLGERWARVHEIPLAVFPVTPADWQKYGKRAGYLRNMEMAEVAEAVVLLWDGRSKGTKHMMHIADKFDLVIHACQYDWITKKVTVIDVRNGRAS